MRIGIIGGTGVYELGHEMTTGAEQVPTPYGAVEVAIGAHEGRELVFLPRHGAGHKIPPHKINYLANIDAMRISQCDRIIATNAVGAIHRDMQPGDFVVPDQFIDFTKCRPLTFFDGEAARVRHVDVTEPYCPAMRATTLSLLRDRGAPLHPAATYVCTEGPRFETPAEIRMFEGLGGDLVGMTGVPEVVLAREVGICYMSLCIVTNAAAGISAEPLSEGEVTELMKTRLPALRELVGRIVAKLDDIRECGCRG